MNRSLYARFADRTLQVSKLNKDIMDLEDGRPNHLIQRLGFAPDYSTFKLLWYIKQVHLEVSPEVLNSVLSILGN